MAVHMQEIQLRLNNVDVKDTTVTVNSIQHQHANWLEGQPFLLWDRDCCDFIVKASIISFPIKMSKMSSSNLRHV